MTRIQLGGGSGSRARGLSHSSSPPSLSKSTQETSPTMAQTAQREPLSPITETGVHGLSPRGQRPSLEDALTLLHSPRQEQGAGAPLATGAVALTSSRELTDRFGQDSTPTSPSSPQSPMGDGTGRRSTRRRATGVPLMPSQFSPAPNGSNAVPAFMKAFDDPSKQLPPLPTYTPTSTPPTTSSTATAVTATGTKNIKALSSRMQDLALVMEKDQQPQPRPGMSPRRHTTSSGAAMTRAASIFSGASSNSDIPPVPPLAHSPQRTSAVNPTLRQIQTPHIPTNLVQARIMQQEEQKRAQEELAKIPITANLRTVKKIQAVIVSDEEDETEKKKRKDEMHSSELDSDQPASGCSSATGSISSRPRSKTATAGGSPPPSVTVSLLPQGSKQRGDRNRVEPVAIPKRLVEQVEHILGRKLAGKGSALDERENEREASFGWDNLPSGEEEARKAAELPPIVLGKPRKRAVTSAHILNLVSSWDTKVEVAREVVSEAEKIKQFLEERSTAHSELPKSKVPITASELLKPLPTLPPPPPISEVHLNHRETQSLSRQRGRVGKGLRSASISVGSSSSLLSASSSTFTISSASSSPAPSPASSFSPLPVQSPSIVLAQEVKIEENTGSGSPKVGVETIDATEAIVATVHCPPSVPLPEAVEVKRSGEVLVSKALVGRPRRKGVRNPVQ
ncbi:hypothetical protein BGW38_001412 [Lunasporangiospora selenospora]|uniref:Uncharacterized protein n=1 Tax=Lunasporangiospora selenospora TaxID=979761 RepID=A0A9P6FTG5_9FUNG|nr:hypothetical protein BGW38_001412 [Lunasporangiospora selenospora]